MTPKNIAIIGAGNLGSRHLQALALTELPLSVQVVDPSQEALNVAKERWQEMPPNELVEHITFHKELDELEGDFDVVIVATSSKPRRAVVENLLIKNKVRYMVLEKVLFPRLSDYDEVGQLLDRHKVQAWVNCGRRNNAFYKKMRELFKSEQNISMTVSGDGWGLGCNSIHYLDTYSFITNQRNFSVDTEYIDKNVISSKRGGYIEFTGSIRFKSEKGNLLLTSYNQGYAPSIIILESENLFALICESQGYADLLIRKDWQWKKFSIALKYQSQLTQELVKDLVCNGDCGLPTYNESTELHKVMLKGFLDHYQLFKQEDVELCPIT